MSLHSFVKDNLAETTDTQSKTNTSSATPEPSRRYVQWKEDDVGLLLTDLEQPGHYGKWKENKSGFSKRVAEGVFNNAMYHEAIKFKVRWLESRFRIWHQQLTSPEVVNDESAILNIREKMFKEFPYYDRCKPIFLNENSTLSVATTTATATVEDSPVVVQPETPTVLTSASNRNIAPMKSNNTSMMKPEPTTHLTNEASSSSSPTLDHEMIDSQRSPHPNDMTNMNKRISTSPPFAALKKKKVVSNNNNNNRSSLTAAATTSTITSTNGYYDNQNNLNNNNMNNRDCIYRNTENGITDDRRVQMMEFELELKKMDHQERMQEMKLEQLRLEIELQKLKRDTPMSNRLQYHATTTD